MAALYTGCAATAKNVLKRITFDVRDARTRFDISLRLQDLVQTHDSVMILELMWEQQHFRGGFFFFLQTSVAPAVPASNDGRTRVGMNHDVVGYIIII